MRSIMLVPAQPWPHALHRTRPPSDVLALARTVLLLLAALLLALPAAARAEAGAGSGEAGGLFFRSDRPDVFLKAPVLATDARITINGTVARVRVRQIFSNPSGVWLEGVYVFPLPEQSAVDRLRMRIGERVVVGEIRERAEAAAIYREAAAAGKRASLVSSERPNIFTSSVANVGPGETVTVEIEYQESVAVAGNRFSLRFPMVVAPRYIPGRPAPRPEAVSTGAGWAPDGDRVPDASRITPPVLHSSQEAANPVTLHIEIDAGFPMDQVVSRYHPIVVEAESERRRIITLAEGAVPAGRDFVLEWTPRPEAAPRASLFAEERNGDSHLLVAVIPPTGAAPQRRQPREVIFVIDVSGSMAGTSIAQAKQALLLAIERLAPGDRFNVIRFADETSALFPTPQDWTPDTLRLARLAVNSLEADGGTEMRPALRLALQDGGATGDHLRQVVFLTDAAVGNEAELFGDIAGQLGSSRLFTIGIGSAPNSYFMRKAAELGRGSFTYIGDVTEVTERMDALLRRLERPALTDLTATWPETLRVDAETYPAPVPDLYDGEPVVFAARIPDVRLTDLEGDLTLGGRLAEAEWAATLDLATAQPAEGVAAIWARSKLATIEDAVWRGADPATVKTEATALALRHQLVSHHTSLVAVDQEIARPREESLDRHPVATNLPEGWVHEKVFGAPGADASGPPAAAPAALMQEAMLPGAMADALRLPATATPTGLHLLAAVLLLGLAAASLLAAIRIRGHA